MPPNVRRQLPERDMFPQAALSPGRQAFPEGARVYYECTCKGDIWTFYLEKESTGSTVEVRITPEGE